MIQLMNSMAPTLLVGAAFIPVFVIMSINLPIIKRLGVKVPKFQPFRLLKFPKSILWYYLIVIILSLVVNVESGTYWYMVFVNAASILQLLLVIQGLSFTFYFST